MRRVWPLLLLVLHLAVSYVVGIRSADGVQTRRVIRAHAVLKRVSTLSNDEKYFERLCNDLTNRLIGERAGAALHRRDIRRLVSRLAVTNGKLWLFDGRGRFAGGVASDPAQMERMFETLRKPWHERFGLDRSQFHGVSEMLDDAYWFNLVDRRNQFLRIYNRRGGSWGYWSWRDGVRHDEVGGFLVLLDKKPIGNATVLEWSAADLRREGVTIGWLDRMKPEASRLPRGLPEPVVRAFERDFFSRGDDTFRLGTEDVVVASYREQTLLLLAVPVEQPRLPPVSWILLMLWLLPCVRWILFGAGGSPSLSRLLLVAVGVAGGLPFVLSLVFWRHFAESRTQAVAASLRQELEQRLVRIDRKFPALIERLATRYRRWRARFEAELARDASPPVVDVPNRFGLVVKRFAPSTAKARLVAETFEWEAEDTADTIFLCEPNGVSWRETSDIMILFRRMARWPRQKMMKTLQSLYSRHSDRALNEFDWLLAMPEGGYASDTFYGDNVYGKGTAARLATQLMRASIGQYNIWNNIETGGGAKEDTTLLVTSGMADSTFGDDIVSAMLRNMGNFTISSNEIGAAAIYMDVIRNLTGAAVAGIGAYHYSYSLTARFFEEIAAGMPASGDGMRLFVVSNLPCTLGHPGLDDDRKFSRLFGRLDPPDVLLSDVVRFEGKRVILAALNCRQAWGYYLVGILPWDLVEERVRMLSGQLAAVAACMSLILVVLCLRVWQGIIRPVSALMAGVDAMEARRLEHRIAIATGDELERLADTFNDTLAGMEELEVAKIVQQKLLPSGVVATAAWAYQGVSEMSSEVGGDYHDARVCADGSIVFMLGDVSGHGVSAALVVAMAKAAFGNLVRSGVTDPGALLEQMNAVLLSTTRKLKMMTAVTGLLKPDGTMLLANAGHCYPAALRKGAGAVFLMREGSFPLGVRQRGKWPSMSIALEPGDRLLLYTDGIPEAIDRNGQQLDYERWHRIINEESAEEDTIGLISRLHQRLRDFTQPVRWGDDVTIAVVTRLERQKEKETA